MFFYESTLIYFAWPSRAGALVNLWSACWIRLVRGLSLCMKEDAHWFRSWGDVHYFISVQLIRPSTLLPFSSAHAAPRTTFVQLSSWNPVNYFRSAQPMGPRILLSFSSAHAAALRTTSVPLPSSGPVHYFHSAHVTWNTRTFHPDLLLFFQDNFCQITLSAESRNKWETAESPQSKEYFLSFIPWLHYLQVQHPAMSVSSASCIGLQINLNRIAAGHGGRNRRWLSCSHEKAMACLRRTLSTLWSSRHVKSLFYSDRTIRNWEGHNLGRIPRRTRLQHGSSRSEPW
jgi:hypothetical protein